mmetsp:Transcript_49224/g.96545  ORF Transcript_49224/g.96545 Transcript_49224/m.96545 type:complete len:124 (-) Transcript_49224:311-682(-)
MSCYDFDDRYGLAVEQHRMVEIPLDVASCSGEMSGALATNILVPSSGATAIAKTEATAAGRIYRDLGRNRPYWQAAGVNQSVTLEMQAPMLLGYLKLFNRSTSLVTISVSTSGKKKHFHASQI